MVRHDRKHSRSASWGNPDRMEPCFFRYTFWCLGCSCSNWYQCLLNRLQTGANTNSGGFAGSDLQLAQCPTTPTTATPPAAVATNCIGAYLTMHITKSASGVYLENVWLWTADHDLEDSTSTQITIYTGRGLLVESTVGTIWLVGTAVEHHSLYQYQFANTHNIFAGQIQTETAYYQPNPGATTPFSPNTTLNDPDFTTSCAGVSGNCADGWGLRVINSDGIRVYGAGLYSFFDNYSTNCVSPTFI